MNMAVDNVVKVPFLYFCLLAVYVFQRVAELYHVVRAPLDTIISYLSRRRRNQDRQIQETQERKRSSKPWLTTLALP